MTSIFLRERHREITDRREEGNVTTELESGVMLPPAKERLEPPEAGRGQEPLFLLTL